MNAGLPSGRWTKLPLASRIVLLIFLVALILPCCTEQKEHIARAVHEEDSVPVMTSYGVNMLISDSGVIKYKIVAETSVTNQAITPARTTFDKGVFMTQFDEDLHVQAYIQADTAYKYDEMGLIELRGRVRVLTKNGVRFTGEELYWDQRKHEYYSNLYSFFSTPERALEGNYFRSNEEMTRYYVSNSKGSFEQRDILGEEEEKSDSDSIAVVRHHPPQPRAKRPADGA